MSIFLLERLIFDIYTFGLLSLKISKLAEILIDEEFKRAEKERDDSRYIKRIVKDREEEKTLLHVAAERNLVLIAECLLKYDRDLVYKTTFRGKSNMLPVELALREDCMHDDVASLLIKNMWNKKRYKHINYATVIIIYLESGCIEKHQFDLCSTCDREHDLNVILG